MKQKFQTITIENIYIGLVEYLLICLRYLENALPDTNVWRSKLAYNEPFVEYYFRHPAYQDYPVVGVNWLQATDYAAWRTDRVNEYIMDREKIIKYNSNAEINEENFNSKAYLAGQYDFATKGRNRPSEKRLY